MNFTPFILVMFAGAGSSAAALQDLEPPPMATVLPEAETVPVRSADDAADDPAIWVHPSDPARSRILGTDKKWGLVVYDLAGKLVQELEVGRLNNVDVRQGLAGPDGTKRDLAAATNRTTRTIDLFTIGADGKVAKAGTIPSEMTEPYGVCLFHDRTAGGSGAVYVLACDKDGLVRQWLLMPETSSGWSFKLVRSFAVGNQSEGMVADDELGWLFIGEERTGIWRYDARPTAPAGPDLKRELVDAVTPLGTLTADVEGLDIYHQPDGRGYLVASSQGDSTFRVYERQPPNRLLTSFRIGPSDVMNSVTDTDGLAVTSAALGGPFGEGMLVVQDGDNAGKPQNFKLVAWSQIAPLLVLAEHGGKQVQGATK